VKPSVIAVHPIVGSFMLERSVLRTIGVCLAVAAIEILIREELLHHLCRGAQKRTMHKLVCRPRGSGLASYWRFAKLERCLKI
jgi:hypothetical protein